MEEYSLKILIAEDSPADRMILETIVTQAGYEVIPVANGLEAVDEFIAQKPDIVLLDVIMPEMGGLDAAKKIREASTDELVPILFLTSLSDSNSLVDCIDSGGNDFISKPYNAVVLNAKIKAFARMREMHQTLSKQKKLIEENNLHMLQEQEVAKQVFDKIAHTGCLEDGYLNFYMSPLAVFNGDVIVADVSPTGSLIVLLGDFTGHGLPAAIGSMPLATTFYGMVRKGFSVSDIVREVNQKLHEILPVGFFCCATCIDINVQHRRIRYWNGGLPESMLYRAKDDTFVSLASKNLPLGVLPSKSFNATTERISMEFGDKIYLWSDGIFESRNSTGEMYGEDNLHALIKQNKHSEDLFNDILRSVHAHVGDSEKDDDISLVEIPFKDCNYESKHHEVKTDSVEKLADWEMNLTLPVTTLKQFDPLPLVTNILNEVTGLAPHRTVLYTVIAEMYSNALEHGILKLSSELKRSPQGFVEYYTLRKEKLSDLETGQILIDLHHRQDEDEHGLKGDLTIRMRDSGQGFGVKEDQFINTSELPQSTDPGEGHEDRFYGRGLSLMKDVCRQVNIRAPGNDIEVIFAWHEHDK